MGFGRRSEIRPTFWVAGLWAVFRESVRFILIVRRWDAGRNSFHPCGGTGRWAAGRIAVRRRAEFIPPSRRHGRMGFGRRIEIRPTFWVAGLWADFRESVRFILIVRRRRSTLPAMDSPFLLDPPKGFRPFDPRVPVWRYQRRLPHWRQDGATYFVTFRLGDSLPRQRLMELEALKRQWAEESARPGHSEPISEAERKRNWEERSRRSLAKIEGWLDQGHGECLLANPAVALEVREALMHGDSKDCEVGAAVIMPNHVHLIARPGAGVALEKWLQHRKGRSARQINRQLSRKGSVWQEESFDRIVRDARHLWRCMQYIGRNPGKAGLSNAACLRWVREDWEEAGWRYVDDET